MTYSWTHTERERSCAIINCHNASINHSACIRDCQSDGWPKALLLTHYACEASCGLNSVAFVTGEQPLSVLWRLFPLASFPSSVWMVSFLFSFLSRFDSLHSSFSPFPPYPIDYCPELERVDEVWHGKVASAIQSVLGQPWNLFMTLHPQ